MVTATAIPGRRERAAARPVPWARLAWVTWRQHRAALAGAAAFLAVIAAYLAYMGWEIHRAYDSLNACEPASLRGLPLLSGRLLGTSGLRAARARLHVLLRHRTGLRAGVRDQRADGPVPAAGRPGAGRRLRRRAGAGPRTGVRHVPFRVDAGRGPGAPGGRPAGAARGRPHRRRVRSQRAVLLVLRPFRAVRGHRQVPHAAVRHHGHGLRGVDAVQLRAGRVRRACCCAGRSPRWRSPWSSSRRRTSSR